MLKVEGNHQSIQTFETHCAAITISEDLSKPAKGILPNDNDNDTYLALPMLESSTTRKGQFLCGRLSI